MSFLKRYCLATRYRRRVTLRRFCRLPNRYYSTSLSSRSTSSRSSLMICFSQAVRSLASHAVSTRVSAHAVGARRASVQSLCPAFRVMRSCSYCSQICPVSMPLRALLSLGTFILTRHRPTYRTSTRGTRTRKKSWPNSRRTLRNRSKEFR